MIPTPTKPENTEPDDSLALDLFMLAYMGLMLIGLGLNIAFGG